MKKFIAFLLACMMLMSTTAFADSAYAPLEMKTVMPQNTIAHTLTLN